MTARLILASSLLFGLAHAAEVVIDDPAATSYQWDQPGDWCFTMYASDEDGDESDPSNTVCKTGPTVVSWIAPTENVNGTPLEDLASFRLVGVDQSTLPQPPGPVTEFVEGSWQVTIIEDPLWSCSGCRPYEEAVINNGELVYTDRDFVFEDVLSYGGRRYIRTANSDKEADVSIFITAPEIIVAHDRRIPPPAWLVGWEDLGQQIITDDSRFDLYRNSGTHTLGPNGGVGQSMYFVLF